MYNPENDRMVNRLNITSAIGISAIFRTKTISPILRNDTTLRDRIYGTTTFDWKRMGI